MSNYIGRKSRAKRYARVEDSIPLRTDVHVFRDTQRYDAFGAAVSEVTGAVVGLLEDRRAFNLLATC